MSKKKTASIYLWIAKCVEFFAFKQTARRLLIVTFFFVCLVVALGHVSSAWGELIFRGKFPEQAVFPEVGAIAAAPDDHLWVLEYTGHRIFKFDSNNSAVLVTITGDKLNYGCVGLAVDSSGNVYASSFYGVLKFDSSGNFLGEFGIYYGEHIAVDSSGSIYLTGYGNIEKFDSSGSPLAHWGTLGSGDGQFGDSLGGIAVDGSGNIYVTDTLNYRVQKLDSSGNFLAKWGIKGTGYGQFGDSLGGIAVDSAGNVYVTDSGNKRVQKFDNSGNFLAAWQISSVFYEGLNPFPDSGVAVDSSGNVYVHDYFNQLQKFDGNGTLIAKWGTKGSATGFFNNPLGVALDSSSNIYVADSGNKRIQKFDNSGHFLAAWGSYGSGPGKFTDPSDVAVNSSGDVYVSDSSNHNIQKFDSNGNLLAKWGNWGDGNGQFSYPNSVAVDRAGNIYVADTENYRIQKFDGNGNFINQWRTWVSIGEYCYTFCFLGCSNICTSDYLAKPRDIALDTLGNIYLFQDIWLYNSTSTSVIIKYDSSGHFLARWDAPGSGIKSGWNQSSSGITVDSFNNIYVTNAGNIKKFDSKGKILAKWGTRGVTDGQFNYPSGIAVDSAGNVYVSDTGNYRIQKFEQTFKIKGAVKKANGTPIVNALVTLSGGISATATTNSSGKYKFEDIPNGSYTVNLDKTGYAFTPASADVTVYGNDVSGQDFMGATVFISGVVKKANGTPIAGVLMTLSGDADNSVITDSNGKYRFNRIADGNYTITPDKKGFIFIPAIITLDISGSSVKGQKFIGTKN